MVLIKKTSEVCVLKWYLLLKHFKGHSSKIIITSPEILKTNKDIAIIQVLFKKRRKGK